MRKVLAAVLAVPVAGFLYLATLAHRTLAGRVLVAVGTGAALGVAVVALVPARPTTAIPPSIVRPLPAVAFDSTLTTGVALRAPVVIHFATPMDAASVAAALRVDPVTAVSLTWDPAGRALAVQPVERWAPGVLHAVTVDAGAVDTFGQPLASPARSVFVTREAVAGTIAATTTAGARLALDSGFRVAFDAPVDIASAAAAFRVEPAVAGRLVPTGRRGGVTSFTFQPAEPLTTDTVYRVWFDQTVVDVDGAAVTAPTTLVARTIPAPSVVRFRPRAGTAKVARSADIAVRFTLPMQRASTAKAFHLLVNGKAVPGRITWGDGDTVLMFDPATAFPYGATVVATVDGTARSRAGASLTAAKDTFTVVPKPKPKPKPRPKATSRPDLQAADRRGQRRVRVLDRGRALLPQAHELHADRRLGDIGREVLVAGRTERATAEAGLGHQLAGLAAVREAARPAGDLQPLHQREPGRPPAARGLHELPLGREPRLPERQPVRRGPGLASVLPERALVPRRPLREPDELGVRPRRASACGCRAAACAW